MLSQKERNFQPHVVSLEALVPEENFYRQLEAKLDLTFVRDLVRHLYKPFGRPGIVLLGIVGVAALRPLECPAKPVLTEERSG